MTPRSPIYALLLALFCSVPTLGGELVKDLDNKENILAGLMVGSWEVDTGLCESMGIKPRPLALSFTLKPDALPDAALEKLAGRLEAAELRVFAIGLVTLGEKTFPFALTVLSGNPHVVFYQPRNGDPLGDTESFNLMGLRAGDDVPGPADRLFVGGDFNNQGMLPFRRVKAK